MYEIRTKCYMLHHVTYIIATYCRLGINAAGSAISCLQLEIQGWQIGIKMVLQSWTVKWPYFIILPACCGVISFKWHWISCRDCYLSLFERERERECMRVLAWCGIGWNILQYGNRDIANLPCSTVQRVDGQEHKKQKVKDWRVMVRKLQYNLALDTAMQKKMLIFGYEDVCCWLFLMLAAR